MRESIIFNNQLMMTINPPFGDDLMLLRDSKGRLLPHSHSLLLSEIALYGQKAYLELHPCDPSCKVGRDTQKHMGHDTLYPPHPYLLESMTLLEDTIESLNDCPLLIEAQEGFTLTDRSHYILCLIVFFEIEDRSVSSLPADGAKQTCLGLLLVESAAEFESLSFGFSSPVGKLESCLTGVLAVLGQDNISSLDRIFSTPWVFCNDGGDIIFNQIACIFHRVISCISDEGIDLFIYFMEGFLGFFGKLFEKLSIPLICRGYLNSKRDRQLRIGDLKMDLVAKEAEVFALSSPGGIGIGFFGLDMGGIDREPQILLLNETEGLSYEVHYDLGEGFLPESLSEVVECVVVWGISVGEATEVGESSVVAEFSCKVSFGGGVSKIYKQECFEEGDRVVAFSTFFGVFIFDEFIDEREVDELE